MATAGDGRDERESLCLSVYLGPFGASCPNAGLVLCWVGVREHGGRPKRDVHRHLDRNWVDLLQEQGHPDRWAAADWVYLFLPFQQRFFHRRATIGGVRDDPSGTSRAIKHRWLAAQGERGDGVDGVTAQACHPIT